MFDLYNSDQSKQSVQSDKHTRTANFNVTHLPPLQRLFLSRAAKLLRLLRRRIRAPLLIALRTTTSINGPQRHLGASVARPILFRERDAGAYSVMEDTVDISSTLPGIQKRSISFWKCSLYNTICPNNYLPETTPCTLNARV